MTERSRRVEYDSARSEGTRKRWVDSWLCFISWQCNWTIHTKYGESTKCTFKWKHHASARVGDRPISTAVESSTTVLEAREPRLRACNTLRAWYKTKRAMNISTHDSVLLVGSDLLSHKRSTIGATGLNFSVRNGKRWNTRAIATICSLDLVRSVSFGVYRLSYLLILW